MYICKTLQLSGKWWRLVLLLLLQVTNIEVLFQSNMSFEWWRLFPSSFTFDLNSLSFQIPEERRKTRRKDTSPKDFYLGCMQHYGNCSLIKILAFKAAGFWKSLVDILSRFMEH